MPSRVILVEESDRPITSERIIAHAQQVGAIVPGDQSETRYHVLFPGDDNIRHLTCEELAKAVNVFNESK